MSAVIRSGNRVERYVRMSADRKLEILRSVEGSAGRVAETLSWLEVSPSTYYRWR